MAHDSTNLVKGRLFGSVTRKAVMLVLADYTDAEWSTFVGQKRAAAEAEVSERTVRSVLAAFEDEGLITRTHRGREGDRGGRTSDRIQLHREAIQQLPVAFAGKSGNEAADTDSLPESDAIQAATAAPSNGKAIAGEQSGNRGEGGASPNGEGSGEGVRETDELPAVQWAKRWAEVRGVTLTRSVKKAWVPKVQEFISAGGLPSEGLLAAAVAAGIESPGGWGFVGSKRVVEIERRQRDCDDCGNRGLIALDEVGSRTDWDDPASSTMAPCPSCAGSLR